MNPWVIDTDDTQNVQLNFFVFWHDCKDYGSIPKFSVQVFLKSSASAKYFPVLRAEVFDMEHFASKFKSNISLSPVKKHNSGTKNSSPSGILVFCPGWEENKVHH